MGFVSLPRLAKTLLGLAVAVVAWAAMPAASGAQQPGTVKSNHGAWSIVCDQPAGATCDQ